MDANFKKEIIKGILIGSDWDSGGRVKKFSLLAAGEIEFEAVSKNKSINLLDFLRATVEARGSLKSCVSKKTCKQSFIIDCIKKIERIED